MTRCTHARHSMHRLRMTMRRVLQRGVPGIAARARPASRLVAHDRCSAGATAQERTKCNGSTTRGQHSQAARMPAMACAAGGTSTQTTQLSELAQRQIGEGVVDLQAGQPGPALLPLARIAAAAQHRLAGPAADPFLLQYGPEQGYLSFRQCLAQFLSKSTGHSVDADELLITAGVSHGLDLVCRHLARPGEAILVEQPTYFLAGTILRGAGLVPVPVPTGPDGIDIDALQQLLERPGAPRPTLAYIIPIHNNPTGATLPLCKRQRLVQLSHMHGFLIVADEVYQLLSFPGAPPPPPPMREVERAMHAAGALQQDGGGRSICSSVVSLGSFSKINSPGLRLGWCDAAAPQLLKLRADGVLGSGGSIAPLASGIAHSLLQLGSLQEHLHGTIRPSLEHNCAALCDALEQHLPPGCSFQRPQGGYFVWVKLPQQMCAEALLAYAAEAHNVRFLPGRVCDGQANGVRLSFAFYTPPELQEGARRLGAAIAAFAAQHAA